MSVPKIRPRLARGFLSDAYHVRVRGDPLGGGLEGADLGRVEDGGLLVLVERVAVDGLVELDLASNRLVAVPPLGELPMLQVLRLQRNQIARNWGELSAAQTSLRELDVSHNRLAWQQPTGEFDAAMQVLSSLRKLKELRLGGNPISETPALSACAEGSRALLASRPTFSDSFLKSAVFFQ